ncbi:MAG: isoprenylcysteine carboxylmethyltransferase family protein [Gammaproteobacteria bacterium]
MTAFLSAFYSICVYLFFFATFLYSIGFVENAMVSKTIDSGSSGNVVASIVINVLLLTVFALQHSVMARPGFKRVWTRIVSPHAERSTYVLFASLALALLIWQWRPLPQMVWSVEDTGAAVLLRGISLAGWAMVLLSTFLISHVQLFGLSQGFARLLGRQPSDMPFQTPYLYRWLRHPIYAGFIVAFWATPTMSVGHLLFAFTTTAYIFIGIWLEERDLIAHFGDRYRQYRTQVGMLFPRLGTARMGRKPGVADR